MNQEPQDNNTSDDVTDEDLDNVVGGDYSQNHGTCTGGC